MHRQAGRHLKPEYYEEVEYLPDKQLFSPTEIVRRKYDKNSQYELFNRMFHSLYQFGVRNGLSMTPDNCLRQPGGKRIMENGKVLLKPRERRPKWYGKTWKSKLYDEDHVDIKRFAMARFVRLLVQIQAVKLKEQSEQKVRLEREVHMKRTKVLRKFGWLAAALVAIALTAGVIFKYNFLHDGYDVLRREGPQAALAFFQDKAESYDHLFGSAWAAYRNGDYKISEELSYRIQRSPMMKDQARASYLLGILKTTVGEFELASEYLLTALAMYETMGNANSLFRTRTSLAKLYLAQKDLDNAIYFLNLSEMNDQARTDQYFFYLKSQVAFLQSDFDAALTFSLQRDRVFDGDHSQLASIYSDIGLYYGLNGDLLECFKYTMKADGVASKQGDANSLIFNKINMLLYFKCSKLDYSDLRKSILVYARSKKETRLMDLVYFIDKFSCPLTQAGNGHPPPPDDPPADPPPPGETENRNMPGDPRLDRNRNLPKGSNL